MAAPDPGWKWSEQHQKHYRQEYRDGKWITTWDPRGPTPASAGTATHSAPKVINTRANSGQSQSAANQNRGPHYQQHGALRYGTQTTSTSQISTGLSSLSLVGRETSTRANHDQQKAEVTVASSSRRENENRQRVAPNTVYTTLSNSPPRVEARPIIGRTISAPATQAYDPTYFSQSMPPSGGGRINGKQVASAPGQNSQTTSSGPANPGYKHAATSTEDDDLLSNYAHARIKGTNGPCETLDPSFHIIDSRQEWTFFVTGRVFSMLVWQPADEGYPEGLSLVRYGERAYAKVYRFIIIKPKCAEHYSKCIRISTHCGQGATKRGLNQSEHCMIYSDNEPPGKLPGETKMNKDPIHMDPCDPTKKLDHASRADLARTYPVEHNVKVQNVGMISKIHMKRLGGYVRDLQ